MIIAGDDVEQNVRIRSLTSIMDLSPTLCEIAKAPVPPDQDGISLFESLTQGTEPADRPIYSELLAAGSTPARMVRKDNWKYVIYAGDDRQEQLFDLENDPGEYQNCIEDNPVVATKLRTLALADWNPEEVRADQIKRRQHWTILSEFGAHSDVPEPERWPIPESAWKLPEA